MDYFTNSRTFSVQWPVTHAGSGLYLHEKRKSLLITNISNNFGVAEDTVSDLTCHFQHS